MKPVHPIALREADPLSPEALRLLHEAALEARALYPELHDPDAPAPTNRPTPPRGVYLIAFAGSEPVGMAAHRPLDEHTSEVRRMFVTAAARQQGVGLALLQRLEAHARSEGFERLVLETGHRQIPAMRLYERMGYHRIPAFGPYAGDPTSVCFAKDILPTQAGRRVRATDDDQSPREGAPSPRPTGHRGRDHRSSVDDLPDPGFARPPMPTLVVVSGLPASGKTSLAAALAVGLQARHLDKDTFLEALLDQADVHDPQTRSALSRLADDRLRNEALASPFAVVSSWRRHPASASLSGTPVSGLKEPGRCVIEVHCACPAAEAVRRFRERRRHPGHLDALRSPAQLLAQFQDAEAQGPLFGADAIVVSTAHRLTDDALTGLIDMVRRRAFTD